MPTGTKSRSKCSCSTMDARLKKGFVRRRITTRSARFVLTCRRWTPTSSGLPYGPCGLCAIHDFNRIGVSSLKIVGREASPYKKLASVRMVRTIVDQVRSGAQKLVTIERAKSLRGEREHCDSGYMCYYKVEV